MTVYDTPTATEETAILATARNSLINSNILPVFLVSTDAVVPNNYYNTLVNKVNGLPALVMKFNPSGDNLQQVMVRILQLASSFPFLTAVSSDNNKQIDFATLNSNADTLNIYGLISPQTRARFIIPMLKYTGDNVHRTAVVSVPGFGSATIQDVEAGYPTARSGDVVGMENATCIPITLYGITYKNLLPPAFIVSRLPVKGSLAVMDSTKVGFVGSPIILNQPFSKSTICFIPPTHDYSFPV
jgi:hypothetical protein